MAKTILLADDSPTIRKIVELTFGDTEIRVEAVGDGAQALASLNSLGPDLVLADVGMPEPTGYEICRRVKSSERPVPVVLLTGTFEAFDPDLARECGADAHLVKPFESQALVDKVRELLEAAEAATAVEEQLEVEALAGEVEEATPALELESEITVSGVDGGYPQETAAGQPGPVGRLTQQEIDAVARAVVGQLSDRVVREIAREIVPELATSIIRERIRELENEEP